LARAGLKVNAKMRNGSNALMIAAKHGELLLGPICLPVNAPLAAAHTMPSWEHTPSFRHAAAFVLRCPPQATGRR
jgi:hypothetical protein